MSSVIKRRQHYTDQVGLPGLPQGQVRRTIRNNVNFEDQDEPGVWRESDDTIIALAESIEFKGYTFTHKSTGPMSTFFGSEPVVYHRHAADHSRWLLVRALDGGPSTPVLAESNRAWRYPGLWPGCALVWRSRHDGSIPVIRINNLGLPNPPFRFEVTIPAGSADDDRPDGRRLNDGSGRRIARLRRAYSEDTAPSEQADPESPFFDDLRSRRRRYRVDRTFAPGGADVDGDRVIIESIDLNLSRIATFSPNLPLWVA